jgi:Leucine-rich repeat (LRR) protein
LREKERHTQIWRDACERGRTNGHILVCGENLGYIWDELKDLESTFSIPLVSLSLIGHGLETCDHVGQKVKRLSCLNLSSNKIHSIDDSMGTLTSLMELNLSHNNLERLPDCIGNLQQLQELNLAHNLLTALPSTFIQLCNLRRLTVEHNRIRQLAFYIGNWKACCELNINNNCLIMLPNSISELPLLERLLVNENYLQSLPTELCQLQSIKVLHASRNLLVSIPDNIGNLTSLESLWLDFNKLSSIPHGFHGLVNLCDLRLEGNVDMVHPPMDVIQYGAESVKKWSETRLVISMKDRQRHIITALQDILNQVGTIGLRNEQGERVDVSSMYQKDVELNGGTYDLIPTTGPIRLFL